MQENPELPRLETKEAHILFLLTLFFPNNVLPFSCVYQLLVGVGGEPEDGHFDLWTMDLDYRKVLQVNMHKHVI